MSQLSFSGKWFAWSTAGGAVLFAAVALLSPYLENRPPASMPMLLVTMFGGAFIGLLLCGALLPLVAWYQMGRERGASPLVAVLRIVFAFALAGIPIAILLSAYHLLPWLALLWVATLPWTVRDIIQQRRLRTITPDKRNLPMRR
ncbi:hypothetical protein [Chitinilyticum litopenaei]|uniref:hypothetical protein n=1 Tax=Chitinilyticum litopenaei TaxID=1121276 RepID=UPI0004084AC5|nr:hypothetical protein [Chitinilyticum litopenaei]